MFFGEFYSALLPRRQFGGVALAAAITAGANSCRKRFADVAARLKDDDLISRWEESVDSFVLFGDPPVAAITLKRTKGLPP